MAFGLLLLFDTQLGFVAPAEDREESMKMEANGEFNSSSSSSLVYDFLSTEDPLLLSCDCPPTSPIMLATDAVEGGK